MRLIYLLPLIQIAVACSSSDSNIFEIDPRNFVDNKITLSEIANDIKYIPLDNSFPIGITYTLRITKEHIYLSIKEVGIVQFDRNGKFVRKIGSRGKGPGEYWYGMNFTVDDLTGNVYVLDHGIVKVYSPSGIFLRDILLKGYAGGYSFSDLEIFNSLLFFPDYIPTGDSKYSWVFIDTLGHLVATKKNSVPPFQSGIETEGSTYKFENKLFYSNYFNDTIFSISSNLSNSATYLFAQGDHRWPKERIDIESESIYRLFRHGGMFETNRFIVFVYAYLERYTYCLIDKKTKETFLANKYEKTPGRYTKYKPWLINDLDGGMPLSGNIKYYSENEDEFIITLINPFNLKTYVASAEFKSIIPKYPEKKKELIKLADSMKETDNPVLVLVRLKD